MGGRGMLSGSAKYGEEYRSLGTFSTSRGEVKVIKSRNSKNNKRPYFTMTKNRVYATVDHQGRINNLYFFDSSGRIREEWNISHDHGDILGPHKHIGFEHSNEAFPLTDSDLAYLEEVRNKW